MRVVRCHEHVAICHDGFREHEVDITLVGQTNAGTWLLVFLGAAREILEEADALRIRDALQAMSNVMQ
ncbi:unnamed protein product, partial [Cyprideis torosa]